MSYPQLLTPEEKLAAAKQRLNIPRIVVICGSTRFMAEMQEANLQETVDGSIVVAPGCNMKEPHPRWANPDEAEALKARLDELHRAKIRLADEVLIVGAYIGDSTRAEIAYARELGKPVRFTHPETEYMATPCSPSDCEPGGEPCDTHERLMSHAEGDHELCGSECTADRCTCDSEDHTHDGGCVLYVRDGEANTSCTANRTA